MCECVCVEGQVKRDRSGVEGLQECDGVGSRETWNKREKFTMDKVGQSVAE